MTPYARAKWWAGALLMFMGVVSSVGGLATLPEDRMGRVLGWAALSIGVASIVIGARAIKRA